jgi:hypothetical protein
MQIQDVDFSLELMRAVLWQYEGAKKLQGIIAAKQAWYDENQEAFWLRWYRDVFNLFTAGDFGLTVWGIILGIRRTTFVAPGREDYPAWGFTGRKNFCRGNFNNFFTNTLFYYGDYFFFRKNRFLRSCFF